MEERALTLGGKKQLVDVLESAIPRGRRARLRRQPQGRLM